MTAPADLALFKSLLEGPDEEETNDKGPICPITCAPPGENGIRLPCGHHFSYNAIFSETLSLRATSSRPYDTDYVPRYHVRCPYCRAVSPGLLPYVPSLHAERISGVNSPQRRCRAHVICTHALVKGARKGETCGKVGFLWNGRALCVHHWKNEVRKEKDRAAWSAAHDRLAQSNTVASLRAKLKEQGLPVYGTKNTLVLRLCAQTQSVPNGTDSSVQT